MVALAHAEESGAEVVNQQELTIAKLIDALPDPVLRSVLHSQQIAIEALQGRMNEHIALHIPLQGDNKPEPAQPAAAGFEQWLAEAGDRARHPSNRGLCSAAWHASAAAERERIARRVDEEFDPVQGADWVSDIVQYIRKGAP